MKVNIDLLSEFVQNEKDFNFVCKSKKEAAIFIRNLKRYKYNDNGDFVFKFRGKELKLKCYFPFTNFKNCVFAVREPDVECFTNVQAFSWYYAEVGVETLLGFYKNRVVRLNQKKYMRRYKY